MKRFKLTTDTKIVFGRKLYRIEALVSFGSVSKGDLGGFIEKEENLPSDGNAWVYGNAQVYGNARVYGDAQVYGNAWVSGDARVYGDADCMWFSRVGSENGTLTAAKTKTGVFISRGCFSGSLEEFEAAVKNTHQESQVAKEYSVLIQFIKLRFGV